MLPTLSHFSVSYRPETRLRHWYSSAYLQISPLHAEFQSPLLYSSYVVCKPNSKLSFGLSTHTYITTYMPFTPNKSEQRLPPTYYRGCWHVVSRGLFIRYSHRIPFLSIFLFVPYKRTLQHFCLRRSRGVAPSGLLPLRKILSCCLP